MITEIVAIVTTFVFVASIYKLLLPRAKISPQDKAVLITGCDTGFGHELAKCLHSLGFVVFAGCLNVRGEGAHQLKDATLRSGGGASERLHVVQMDVTKEVQVSDAVQSILALLPKSTGAGNSS